MTVGLCQIWLRLPENHSLKGKRQVIKSLVARIHNRFNVAVAEVGGQGTWQCVVLGICTVSGDAQSARKRLEKTIDFIEDLHLAEVTGQEVEIL